MAISDKAAWKFIDREQEVRLYREQKAKTDRCKTCGYRDYITDVGIICAYILKEGHSHHSLPGMDARHTSRARDLFTIRSNSVR